MLRKFRRHLTYANVMATLALFLALAGGSAWAMHEVINSSDVVNESLLSEDIKNGEIGSADVKDNSINTFDANALHGSDIIDDSLTGADISESLTGNDVFDNTVSGADITNESLLSNDIRNFNVSGGGLGNGDFLTGSVNSRVVTDNELTGTDINESTLNLPPTTTATFASNSSPVTLNANDSFTKVASKVLPAGSWAIVATANTTASPGTADAGNADLVCELRNGNGFIGGATDRRFIEAGVPGKRSLSMNGGAQVPVGGGEVSLWCASQSVESVIYSQMMMIRLDGFS